MAEHFPKSYDIPRISRRAYFEGGGQFVPTHVDRKRVIFTPSQNSYYSTSELNLRHGTLRVSQENASLLGSLFSEKFNHLDKLSADYLYADSDKERMVAKKKFKDEIASMRAEDLFLSLETDLDRFCDGVMTKLKSQVPSIKGENRKLIALFFAGLPYSTVQLVMNSVSIESLKTARSRFRKEIRAANAPDEALFMRFLEMKSSRK